MEHRNSVLIVEDDVNINGLLKEALEKEGYICTQAFSGTEARMILQGERYSVILLDLMLPGIPGEEVLRDIRKKGNTPVIILTAKDTIDDKVEFLRGGADDYVTKPFDIKEVTARVEVTKEELMQRCGERMEIFLDDPKQALPVLDQMGFKNYQVTDKNTIHIYERLDESAAVNMELAKAGVSVRGIGITSEELENYFLNLTGGACNA